MATIKAYTDISQAKKLAEILPLESADMCYYEYTSHIDGTPKVGYKEGVTEGIPCWSLATLFCVIPGGQVNRMDNSNKWEASSWNEEGFELVYFVEDYDNPVDACYDLILKLHEFNLL